MQAVHCWELGIKAVVVLEQAQVTVSAQPPSRHVILLPVLLTCYLQSSM